MPIERAIVRSEAFNPDAEYPFELRQIDFEAAMQDAYDFFFDMNTGLRAKGLARLDEMLRPANMSGVITDMLSASVAKHSRTLAVNAYHNGHPDLVVGGVYPNNSIKSGDRGVEIKTTRKPGGAVDSHGARKQLLCVFVYELDNETEPAQERRPMVFREVYLGPVDLDDYRRNDRGELGTRTATLDAAGLKKFRKSWIYLDPPPGKE
ncbi:MAG: hypothetical protein M3O87_01215 [Candidatus Dormibacteraeota bacterium]|nr:hypothetical protein [Candidatus Dormibacteraeota bacterium]